MKQEALIAWTSLYIGVGMMALICAVLAVLVTADDWRSGRWRSPVLPLAKTHRELLRAPMMASASKRPTKIEDFS